MSTTRKSLSNIHTSIDNEFIGLLNSLNDAIAHSDFQHILHLKREYPYWKIAINMPLQAVIALKNMLIAVTYRKLKAFHIVPVILLPEEAKSDFSSFSSLLQKESFICAVNESMTDKEGTSPVLRIYYKYRRHSTPLSLNVIYTDRENWKKLQKSMILSFLNVTFMDKDIDAKKILSLIISKNNG